MRWDWFWWSAVGHWDSQPPLGEVHLMKEIQLDIFNNWIFIFYIFICFFLLQNLDPRAKVNFYNIFFQPHLLPQRDNQHPDPRRCQQICLRASSGVQCLSCWLFETKEEFWYNHCPVPVLLIAAAVPWMLPWDEISVPWLPSIHVVACMAPWVSQHCFMLDGSHGEILSTLSRIHIA